MSTSRKLGFTLIELMISISLGMMIIYTATAAFRVATQSVTICNRLSLENTVMRAGMRIARDEVDFWTGLDDPDNTTQQKLRPVVVDPRYGGPSAFSDMSTFWPGSTGTTESDRGYDPRDSAWAMGNPRVWWRGNAVEKAFIPSRGAPSDLRFGRYGIFANTSTALNSYFKTDTLDASGVSIKIDYGPVQVPHTWLFNQTERLYSMGHYAMMDYLPANALFAWYEPYVPPNQWATRDSSGGYRILDRITDGWQGQPLGRGRATQLIAMALPDPRNNSNPVNLARMQRSSYGLDNYWVTYNSDKRSSDLFYAETAYPDPIMTSGRTAPVSWPGLTVRVHRFIKTSRFVNWARVSVAKPLTGESIEMSFTSFGTTLRGARQQRRSGVAGGWAKWDNAVGATNDVTLDGPVILP